MTEQLNANMAVWDRNKTIDPRYTKSAKVGGMNITSFSLQSVVMMATTEFGMFGKGWGYEVEQERFDEGAIIQPKVTLENGDVQPEVKELTHTLIIRLWYKDGDDKIVCPVQAGHTPYLRRTKFGPSHDDEYYKKTLADAIKKSLSMLGFGADIFLGLTEDKHYQDVLRSEQELKNSSELPAKIEAFTREVSDFGLAYNKSQYSHTLTALHKNHVTKIHSTCAQLGIPAEKYLKKAELLFNARIEELKKQSQQKTENKDN